MKKSLKMTIFLVNTYLKGGILKMGKNKNSSNNNNDITIYSFAGLEKKIRVYCWRVED